MVDRWFNELSIPVPRFICNRRGPQRSSVKTFSVLSAEVIPRRRFSLGLLLIVAFWCSDSLSIALDKLSEQGLVVEARQLVRLLKILGIACERLTQHPVAGVEIDVVGDCRQQVVSMVKAIGRDPPVEVVMAWQKHWQRMLFDIKLS